MGQDTTFATWKSKAKILITINPGELMASGVSGFCYWSATGALNSAVCLRDQSHLCWVVLLGPLIWFVRVWVWCLCCPVGRISGTKENLTLMNWPSLWVSILSAEPHPLWRREQMVPKQELLREVRVSTMFLLCDLSTIGIRKQGT